MHISNYVILDRVVFLGLAALVATFAFGCGSLKPAPDWDWAVSASAGKKLSAGEVAAVDREGNLFVAGTTTGAVSFGGDTIRSRTSFGTYILRYRDGRREDVKMLRTIDNVEAAATEPRRMCIDRDGNIYVAGLFQGVVDFGGDTLIFHGNEWRDFVAKYRANGTLLWARKIISQTHHLIDSFDIDSNGESYFTSPTRGMVTIGDSTFDVQGRSILVRLGSDGSIRWIHPISNGCYASGSGVTVAPDGNVIVAGQAAAPLDLDASAPSALNANLPIEGFLAAYSPEGERKWIVSLDRFITDTHTRACIDDKGIYLFPLRINDRLPADRRSAGRASDRKRELYMAGFTWDGASRWSEVVARDESSTLFYGEGMGIDALGHLYTLITFTSHIHIGDSLLTAAGSDHRDLVITSHDVHNGKLRWFRQGGGEGDEAPLDMAVSERGDLYITGWYYGKSRYAGIELPQSSSDSYFLVRLRRE
jgi:hypothetical protein